MSESEEEFDLNSSEKKPKLSDIHINYEASAKSYLNRINKHISSLQGFKPKYLTLEAFKS